MCTNCEGQYTSATAHQIITAWADAVRARKSQVALATQRLEICQGCEHRRSMPNGAMRVIAGKLPERLVERHAAHQFHECGLCKCPLIGKSYVKIETDTEGAVKGGCPANKW